MRSIRRFASEIIFKVLCLLAALVVVGMLFMIVGQLFLTGLPSLSWSFITTPENAAPGYGEGIFNAIVGTIIISLSATLIAGPFGFGTAVYLKRYAPDNGITRTFRFLLEVLSGTPSIVVGIFGFLIFVIYLKQVTGGFSLIAGAVALAILIMPVIERGIEEAIDRVPIELEEASYALGANKWQTIRGITVPVSFGAILTGFTLGFGRAAEESAVVLLTAGYTQYMPELGVHYVNGASGGMKIFPLQDQIGTLPVALYSDIKDAALVKPSAGFAAAFVLVMVVFSVNIAGKAFLSYGLSGRSSNKSSLLDKIKKNLFPDKNAKILAIDPEPCTTSIPVILKSKVIAADLAERDYPVGALRPASIASVDPSWIGSEPLIDEQSSSEKEITMPVPPASETQKPIRPRIKIFSTGAGIAQMFNTLRQKVRRWVHDSREKKIPANEDMFNKKEGYPGATRKAYKINIGKIIGPVRSFLLTIAPFVLVASILMVLTLILPVLSPVGSNGPAGLLTVPFMTLILCVIGILCALFLVRNSTLFLLRRRKGKMGNRKAEFAAITTGCCLILIGAFIFSAHLFSPVPSIPASGTEASTGTGILSYFSPSGNGGFSEVSNLILNNSLFSFLYKPGKAPTLGATDASNRSAQLAAFLASQETPVAATPQSTPPAPKPSTAPTSAAPVSLAGSTVPVKNALDVGESYWYGDNSRPCLVTIYNATTLPFYFYWDIDWNRFVQVTPASSGDTFLVIFIRIEDTGNMSAIVPPGAQYVVYYKGQAYYNEPYFDTSVLDANEISIYTANFNLLPYQWIREIGQQKRDYAFLTGYNIFGQNTTVISNYSANNQFTPPTANTPNGEGHFIKPGRSNAIDGYLIYEVPGGVATDLKDTYVQVPFNSFSSTQWRLGK